MELPAQYGPKALQMPKLKVGNIACLRFVVTSTIRPTTSPSSSRQLFTDEDQSMGRSSLLWRGHRRLEGIHLDTGVYSFYGFSGVDALFKAFGRDIGIRSEVVQKSKQAVQELADRVVTLLEEKEARQAV
jgi:hypothetical protein